MFDRESEQDHPPRSHKEGPPKSQAPMLSSADEVARMRWLQRTVGNAVTNELIRTDGHVVQRGKAERQAKVKARNRLSSTKPYHSARLKAKYGVESGLNPPVVYPGNKPLWDGSRARLSFSAATYMAVLNGKGAPVTRGGRIEYQCVRCNGHFPRAQDAIGKEPTIDLDHIQDWNTWVDMHTDPRSMIDKDGHRWYVYLLADVKDAYNDATNLQPMCSTHNRSKGGPTHIDKSVKPEHRDDDCPECSPESEESESEDSDT